MRVQPTTATGALGPTEPISQAPTLTQAQPKPEPPPPEPVPAPRGQREELDKVVAKMNEAAKLFRPSTLKFELADDHRRIVISVIDATSGEIIRQIPPEELIDAFKRMEESMGFLVDRKV